MLEFNDALLQLEQQGRALCNGQTELLPLALCAGRILAEDCIAEINVPPADNSAMDGWAYRSSDLARAPAYLPVSQRICAGDAPQPLQAGSAARIFTGAELPLGADTVVMQENCEASSVDNNQVQILKKDQPGANIRLQGQDIRINDCVLNKGSLLDARHLGLLASLGIAELRVHQRIKVALLSTGDELINAGSGPLISGQIYNSNGPMLSAYCAQLGCELVSIQHVADTLAATKTALKQACEYADLILSCGGVSVGEEDHVKPALEELGQVEFWKIRIKPGKPLAYAKLNKQNGKPCAFVGLPGNPVSAFVTCHLFAATLIRAMQGQTHCQPKHSLGKAAFNIKETGKRPEFLRVKYTEQGLEPYKNQSSGVLSSVAWADALAFIPDNRQVQVGDELTIYPL